MSELILVTAPVAEPLTRAAAKDFLRIGTNSEDALVDALIRSARAGLEAASGLALVTRTLKRRWTEWPSGLTRGGIRLRPGPASALVSVLRRDAEGADEDLSARFELVAGRLCLKAFEPVPAIPLSGAIEVTFRAGFGAPDEVPDDLLHALKLWVQAAYLSGGPVGSVPPGEVQALLDARRERTL